ncbi:hypothetical protein BJ138DRAFT_1156842 [Hygrophoropsis aurantiaca]|uniref:Uncharacterized protein n=1 Tax=Hygrophoropsis aurantiaca TaxID=72124 RepID=A0ACB8A6G0_9AGAM|nr:hypothetical protein BJ138DRAFT_1156842 [Hygrophoropsis aurantiaca]
MVEVALARGDIVVATARKPEALADIVSKHSADKILVELDVTKHEQVVSAFAQAKNAFGRVDIVYNNAGYAIYGEVESVPEDVARKHLDTNFWSAVDVQFERSRAILPGR